MRCPPGVGFRRNAFERWSSCVGKDAAETITVGTVTLHEHEKTSGHPGYPHEVVTRMTGRFRESRIRCPHKVCCGFGVIVGIVENLAVDVREASSGLGFQV